MRWAPGLIQTFAAIAVASCLTGGCAASRGDPTLASDDPALKVPAMRRAAREDRDKDLPKLIDQLDDSDPAIRLFAIKTLERMTGETKGYHFYDAEPVRAAAVRSWREAYGMDVDPPRTLTTQPVAPSTQASASLEPAEGKGGGR